MLKFKRLSDLSKDEKVIVEALKQSKAGLLEVSEDGSKIRRDPAIPLPENTEESRKLLEARTAYAKGFPKENTTLDELLDYFNETNPNVVSIQMRNWSDKKIEPKDDITLPKGATLKLTGLGGEITREDIKDVLQEKFNVNIDKDKGDIAF